MTDLFERNMPQEGDDWVSTIKWMIGVMDNDDKYLEFMVGILAQAIKFDGITPKQEAACKVNLERIKGLFEHGRLKCLGWNGDTKKAANNRIRLVSGGAA